MNKGINLGSLGVIAGGESIQPGQIALANEAAFNQSFLSQPMTDYAVGWKSKDEWLEKLLDFICPGVKTAHRFEYKVANNADEFAMVANDGDVRALFGEFKMVKTIGDIVNAKTFSKGLSTVIEKDTELPGEVEDKVAWLKKMCLKAELYRAVTLLESIATNTAKTWNADAQPDMDMLKAIDAFGDVVGIDANRCLMGTSAWVKRIGAYAAKAKSNFVPPATMNELAGFLGLDEVMGSKVRYTSGQGKNKIVSASKVLFFQGEAGASKDDPSTLKRFWTPEPTGGEWSVYVDEITNPKLKKITVAHTSNIVTTCSKGVQMLTIS